MGWGSGTAEFPYLIDPLTAISHQARHDRSLLDWWFDDWELEGLQERSQLSRAGVTIVGVHSDSGEEYITYDGNVGDRNNLSAWNNGDNVVLAAANVSNNVVVVVHSVGPMDMEKWIDHPNVTAVLWAGLPGQESGNSLVDILYGAYNPSGRLPYTIAKNRSDYPADIDYVPISGEPYQPQVNYTEGLFIDYRHFQQKNIAPRYPFGFGLSYTKFNYTNLIITPLHPNSGDNYPLSSPSANSSAIKVGRFLHPYLQDPYYRISIDVQNIGPVNGCDIPQLYLSFPAGNGEPPKVLRDFARINLDPWEARRVEWTLSRYDLSIWDVDTQEWRIPEGMFGAVVGKDSADSGVKGGFCIRRC